MIYPPDVALPGNIVLTDEEGQAWIIRERTCP